MLKKLFTRLNPFRLSPWEKLKKLITKPIIIIALILLVVSAATAKNHFFASKEIETETVKTKQVTASLINSDQTNTSEIKTVGSIKAESKIEITANTRGTVKGVYFKVGDIVPMNTLLVSLYDNTTLTSLNNAQTNYLNMQNNLSATERITQESINQAEIGVKKAAESVEAAEISLATAQNNLENSKTLREKNNYDTKNNAIISFNGYLNTIFNALNQVNYLIKAEGSIQLANVDHILGAKDPDSLTSAKASYYSTKNAYTDLTKTNLTTDNISSAMSDMVQALAQAQSLVNQTLTVLNNTVTNTSFNEVSLEAQKTAFIGLRTTVVNTQTSAKNTLSTLENLDLIYNQEIDNLENGVLAAQNQLDIAQANYETAAASLANTKQGKEQQILSSQTSLDSAIGQFNLAQAATADLSIKAPIAGQITQKNVELGTEVTPGQKIATIQQAKTVKIEVDLASEDIYRIEKNQMVTLGGEFVGVINSIAPAADPITRKVKVEIVYNNENNDLIPGTFIDVSIPTKQLEKTSETSIFIPLRAVNITQNESYVFVAQSGQAKKVKITTGKTEGAMIEVLAGLKNGDNLIIDGGKDLEDGEKIEIKK